MRGFIGLVGYYRKFIEHFAKIAKPLTMLTRKEISFIWGDEHQMAFQILQEALISEPLLIYPDFSKQFVLSTDASAFAMGAILA